MKPILTPLAALLLAPLAALHAVDAPKTGVIKRPAFHFTPLKGWMNDPNGLLYHGGEYHLYYQSLPDDIKPVIYSGPTGDRAGARISWGHAVSRDLVHWQHLPLAIPEEIGDDRLAAIYSGSAVVDPANRSGLGRDNRPPVVAFYTLMQFARAASVDRWQPTTQPVCMAYSTDSGRTFTKYERNPLVDVGDRKFGDPKVIWHEPSKQWIMVNIWGMKQGKVGFWGSSNLRDWRFLSEFHAEEDALGKWARRASPIKSSPSNSTITRPTRSNVKTSPARPNTPPY
jgi:sucrose-6-phosphate hydrolase SacC (GH32 family)